MRQSKRHKNFLCVFAPPWRSLRLKPFGFGRKNTQSNPAKFAKQIQAGGTLESMKAVHQACLSLLLLTAVGSAQSNISPTPPMGWNSWDSYGTAVTERQVKANADAMAGDLASH